MPGSEKSPPGDFKDREAAITIRDDFNATLSLVCS
jgi:hypothetical protein